MNTKQKSILLLAVSIVALLIIIGGVIFTTLKESDTMKEFNTYFNKSENTIIYYASSTCGNCIMQKPALETIATLYNLDYLEIDIDKISISDRKKILKKLNIEDATPHTVIVKNGKVVDVAVGYKQGAEYLEFFKNVNLVPEDAVYEKTIYPETPNITPISFKEYNELIDSGDEFVVTIGQTGCSHCTAIKPSLDRIVSKKGLKINYLNLTDLVGDERSEFFASLKEIEFNDPEFLEKGSFGTPTTFTIKNGKVVDYIGGERTYSQLEREFKKQGLID